MCLFCFVPFFYFRFLILLVLFWTQTGFPIRYYFQRLQLTLLQNLGLGMGLMSEIKFLKTHKRHSQSTPFDLYKQQCRCRQRHFHGASLNSMISNCGVFTTDVINIFLCTVSTFVICSHIRIFSFIFIFFISLNIEYLSVECVVTGEPHGGWQCLCACEDIKRSWNSELNELFLGAGWRGG